MMLSANLVGFVIGTEGIGYMAKEIVGSWEGASLVARSFEEVADETFYKVYDSWRRRVRVCLLELS